MPTSDAAFRTTLAREAEFVLLGARTHLEGARRARWEALLDEKSPGKRLNWDAAIDLAASHRVLGLLGRQLSARGWRGVPPVALHHIQDYFQAVMLHCTALKRELADVSYALESASIPVVSFKGPTLAHGIYGNAVVRPSADLDILVARRDVGRAHEVLRRAGYAPEAELSPAQKQIHLRVDSVINLSRPAPAPLREVMPQGYAVELHWAITSPCLPFKLDFETVEPRLTSIRLPGVPEEKAMVRALAPEDLLLILGVHGAKHLWERLIWLCDIAELIAKTPDLDWSLVMRLAEERGVLRMTVLSLVLTRDVLGLNLPPEVQEWFTSQPEALRIAARLRASLLAQPTGKTWNNALTNNLTHNLSTDRLLMQTIDAPWHRVGFLWHLVTTPSINERATIASLQGFDFLWWVLRPARVIRKHWLSGKPQGNPQESRA